MILVQARLLADVSHLQSASRYPSIMPTYTGSCLCNSVNFCVEVEPILVSCCHCRNCQKYTGTVFTTNVVFPSNSVRITKGEDAIKIFNDTVQDSGNPLPRHFCSRCASPLFSTNGDFGKTMSVHYSALDDFPKAPPDVEYYSKDRVHWVTPVEGSDKPRTKPGREDSA